MPIKKTASARKKVAAKKTATTATAKRRGRPPGSKNKTAPATKGTTARKSPAASKKTASTRVRDVKKPKSKRGGAHREVNQETGFVLGTDQDAIAMALLEGGESRAEIAERLQKRIDTETRNGTPKQIKNMIAGVLGKMQAAGYTVESSFQVQPPTPASKRAASRRANRK